MAYTRTTLELRLNAHGLYFAEYYGVRPENTGPQNSLAEKAMRKALTGKAARVLFKAGTYQFSDPIIRDGDQLTYVGVNGQGWTGQSTTFFFAGSDGVVLKGCSGLALERLRLRGNDHDKDRGEGTFTGLTINGRSNTLDVGVSGWGRMGVLIEGTLWTGGGGNGYDCSGTRHDNLWVAANWAGVKVVGMDANSISFYGADIRDHVGYGYEDDSLLGTNLFGCMFHGNWAGHIHIKSENAPTGLFGCYEENEENPSKYSGLTGRWGGYSYGTSGGYVQKGVFANNLVLDSLDLGGRLSLNNTYGGHWNVLKNDKGVWEFNLSNVNATRVYLLRGGDAYPGKAEGAVGFGWEYPSRFSSIY
jgi:hypothetical protein